MFRGPPHFLVTFLTTRETPPRCQRAFTLPCACHPGFIYTRGHGSDRPDATLSSKRSPCQSNGLEASLDAAKGSWEHVVCLGDVVGYGPDPNEVTTRIRELGAATIRGNHDKAVADLMSNGGLQSGSQNGRQLDARATLQRKHGLARRVAHKARWKSKECVGTRRVPGRR